MNSLCAKTTLLIPVSTNMDFSFHLTIVCLCLFFDVTILVVVSLLVAMHGRQVVQQ